MPYSDPGEQRCPVCWLYAGGVMAFISVRVLVKAVCCVSVALCPVCLLLIVPCVCCMSLLSVDG